MAERKSKFAEELSNAQQLATANHKRAIEADTAANASLELQKLMEAEIAEAREVQKFNAQLHRDLGREQAHRKRLHNEIEDMKGFCQLISSMMQILTLYSQGKLECTCAYVPFRKPRRRGDARRPWLR